MAILSEDDVRRMRSLKEQGLLSVRTEAVFYGVAAETIRRAVRGETFTKLHAAPPPAVDDSAASLQRLQQMLAAERERAAAPQIMLDEIADDDGLTNRNLAKQRGYL